MASACWRATSFPIVGPPTGKTSAAACKKTQAHGEELDWCRERGVWEKASCATMDTEGGEAMSSRWVDTDMGVTTCTGPTAAGSWRVRWKQRFVRVKFRQQTCSAAYLRWRPSWC
eukprot:3685803-Heterocapsa_arctica.AAC.1